MSPASTGSNAVRDLEVFAKLSRKTRHRYPDASGKGRKERSR